MSSDDDDLFDFSGPTDNSSSSPIPEDIDRSVQDEDLFRSHLGEHKRRYGNSTEKPLIASIIHYAFSVTSRILTTDSLATNARALYDYVNLSSEGEVDERLMQYEMEMTLVMLYAQKALVNTIHETLEQHGRERSIAAARFGMYVDCYVDYLNFSIEVASKQYIEYSEQHGLKIEKSVLERGVYQYVTPALSVMGGNPPGDFHYKYGDISNIRSRTHALITIWIAYGMQLASEKESNTSFEEVFAR